jgi:hypothetical protein
MVSAISDKLCGAASFAREMFRNFSGLHGRLAGRFGLNYSEEVLRAAPAGAAMRLNPVLRPSQIPRGCIG